jgi:hypothetical protein
VLSRKIQDGVTFVGECVNHFFTPKGLHCPCCGGALREEVAPAGQAYLFCNKPVQGCASPVKSFESAQEMYRWRDTIWEVIARTCKQHG